MKIFKTEEYVKMQNPTPGKAYRPEILTSELAKNLGGMFGLLVPGSQVPYHYHNNRESIIIAISGNAIEVIEGKETRSRRAMCSSFPRGKSTRPSIGPTRISDISSSLPIRLSEPTSSR